MFTGIIQKTAKVREGLRTGEPGKLSIEVAPDFCQDIAIGDSVAVSGICLTTTLIEDDGLLFDVSSETGDRTTCQDWENGLLVNLEKSLTPSTAMGGHIVLGHVDGVGKVQELEVDGDCHRIGIDVPEELLKYIAVKGSVAVDGISLTVNEIEGSVFRFSCVPHTWANTNVNTYRQNTLVNVEVDVIARYVERLLPGGALQSKEEPTVTRDYLMDKGFLKPDLEDGR